MFSLKNRLCQLFSTRQPVECQAGDDDFLENNFDLDDIPPCPVCGSNDVAIFIYGKPPLKSFILEGLESGKIISGGCMIRRTAPKWHCYDCNNDFGRLR
jgi:hypothetical protein